MRKVIAGLTLTVMMAGLALPVSTVFARVPGPGGDMGGPPTTCDFNHDLTRFDACSGCPTNQDNVDPSDVNNCDHICCVIETIETLGDYAFWILLTVAMLMILIGAFMFVTAGGNADQTARARRTLLYALAGIALAFLARLIVRMIEGIVV